MKIILVMWPPLLKFKENDFNLNIPRYVDTFEEEPEVDIMALKKKIDVLEEELKKCKHRWINI